MKKTRKQRKLANESRIRRYIRLQQEERQYFGAKHNLTARLRRKGIII